MEGEGPVKQNRTRHLKWERDAELEPDVVAVPKDLALLSPHHGRESVINFLKAGSKLHSQPKLQKKDRIFLFTQRGFSYDKLNFTTLIDSSEELLQRTQGNSVQERQPSICYLHIDTIN